MNTYKYWKCAYKYSLLVFHNRLWAREKRALYRNVLKIHRDNFTNKCGVRCVI